MKTNNKRIFVVLIALTFLMSACNGASPDAAAIATSAVQTVEARYTEQARNQPTETSTSTPTIISTPDASATPQATSTPQPVDSNGKPCYAATVLDITIPDGMIVAPGSTFTKTWRLFNQGNCVWDQSYALTFDNGDAMGTIVKVPLTTRVLPGESVDIPVELTAPTTDGLYKGYWRMSTPFGGTFGVGIYDQSIYVQIRVSSKPKNDIGVSNISIGLYERKPQNGCSAAGAGYTFGATVTVNAATNVVLHWNRLPYDGSKPEVGKWNFKDAGSHTFFFTWNFQPEALQTIDRSVSVTIDSPSGFTSEKVPFHFTCQP